LSGKSALLLLLFLLVSPSPIVIVDFPLYVFLIFGLEAISFRDFFVGGDSSSIISSSSSFELSSLAK
jgi:hypothetical protein